MNRRELHKIASIASIMALACTPVHVGGPYSGTPRATTGEDLKKIRARRKKNRQNKKKNRRNR